MKYFFIFLLIPFLNYSQSKDILKVYPSGEAKNIFGFNSIEIVDGFIFKATGEDPTTKKNASGYIILVKKPNSNNYYLVFLEWSNKLNSYKGNTQQKIKPYGVEVNYLKPNEFKFKGEGIEYTMTFSNYEIQTIDEFGKKSEKIKGQLKSITDVEFMISSYAFNMGTEAFDRD